MGACCCYDIQQQLNLCRIIAFPNDTVLPFLSSSKSTVNRVFTLGTTFLQLTLATGSQLDPELQFSATTPHNCGVAGGPQEVLQTRNTRNLPKLQLNPIYA